MAVFLKINFGGKKTPQNTEAKKLYCNSSTVLVLFFLHVYFVPNST